MKEAVRRAGIEASDVQECIMGNVLSAGLGQNPARQAAVGAGLPVEIGSFTVNAVCGSALKAVMKKKVRPVVLGWYEPPTEARRHLSKPLKRMGEVQPVEFVDCRNH